MQLKLIEKFVGTLHARTFKTNLLSQCATHTQTSEKISNRLIYLNCSYGFFELYSGYLSELINNNCLFEAFVFADSQHEKIFPPSPILLL